MNVDGNDDTTTIDTTGSSWSVTDDWNQLSQSDHINYDYGGTDNDQPMVLNSIDQVTLAALRMQNFGMSAPTIILSEEDEWIQNSIQQIMVVGESGPHHDHDDRTRNDRSSPPDTTVALNTDQFLEEMGDQIARLVRCRQEEEPHANANDGSLGLPLLDECELFEDAQVSTTSTTTDRQGKSSY